MELYTKKEFLDILKGTSGTDKIFSTNLTLTIFGLPDKKDYVLTDVDKEEIKNNLINNHKRIYDSVYSILKHMSWYEKTSFILDLEKIAFKIPEMSDFKDNYFIEMTRHYVREREDIYKELNNHICGSFEEMIDSINKNTDNMKIDILFGYEGINKDVKFDKIKEVFPLVIFEDKDKVLVKKMTNLFIEMSKNYYLPNKDREDLILYLLDNIEDKKALILNVEKEASFSSRKEILMNLEKYILRLEVKESSPQVLNKKRI